MNHFLPLTWQLFKIKIVHELFFNHNARISVFSDPVKPLDRFIWPGGNLKLSCTSPSNLAKTTWERDGTALTPTARLQLLQDGLLILNASDSDTGRYLCQSVEHSSAGQYSATVAEYQVNSLGDGNRIFPKAQINGPSLAGLQAVIGLLFVSLLALLTWNLYKGHIPLPWNCLKRGNKQRNVGIWTQLWPIKMHRGLQQERKSCWSLMETTAPIIKTLALKGQNWLMQRRVTSQKLTFNLCNLLTMSQKFKNVYISIQMFMFIQCRPNLTS